MRPRVAASVAVGAPATPPPSREQPLRRLAEAALAGVGLLALAPLLLGIAAAVRLDVGAPVLFRQRRPGLDGRLFELRKFRTMRDAHSASGVPLADAERLTAFGRFLRSTSLDELPELWNVLVGDMSFVGPRPLLPEYLPLYTPEQARRHDVRPGITGWAQVHGRNALAWDDKFRLDVWYVDHRSVWLDLRILGLTFLRLLDRQGITQPGSATAERFRGRGA